MTKYKNVVPAIKAKYGVAVKSLGKIAKFKNGVLKADFGKGDSFDFLGRKIGQLRLMKKELLKS